MKHCEKCNLDFPGSYRFCGSCGDPLSDSRRCPGCGELAEGKWAFCTNCGLKFEGTEAAVSLSETPGLPEIPARAIASASTAYSPEAKTAHVSEKQAKDIPVREWYSAADLFEETGETTATPIPRQKLMPKTTIAPPRLAARPEAGNGKTVPTLTMLSAYGEPGNTTPPEWKGRHALLVGLLVLVFFGALGFGGWYWWTHRASAAQTTIPAESTIAPAAADLPPSSSSTSTAASTASLGVDEEWKQLREKRIGAEPSDADDVIESLEEAEKKYPHDYRFPYERAKLSIKGITSHHEAFGALAVAAESAIDNGKAQEMLDSLTADKEGDFYKLSRGHHEWQLVVQVLSNRDKRGLNELHH